MSYKTEYKTIQFYSLGGIWGYALIEIEDSKSVKKVRLAKCKTTKEFPKTPKGEWKTLEGDQISNLKQVQKINFKTKEEAEIIFPKLLEMLE